MGISAAGNGVESPAESDRFAAVQDLEDGEALRDDGRAGGLGGFLLVDQVLFAIDGWRLWVRGGAILLVGEVGLACSSTRHGF